MLVFNGIRRVSQLKHGKLLEPKRVPTWPLHRKLVRISDARMDEFIEAELTHFAQRSDNKRPLQPLSLRRIIRMSSEPEEVAQLVAEELPVRFASRVKHIERISGWADIPDLRLLRDMHFMSFRELRMAEGESPEHFQATIQYIRQRHSRIAPLFAEAVKMIQHDLLPEPDESDELQVRDWAPDTHDKLEQWADSLLFSRISTEILMSHFIACIKSKSLGKSYKFGILNYKGHPAEVCRKAAAKVQAEYACSIVVTSLGDDIEFCHIPRYLFYIMEELLTNSARAVARGTQNSEEAMKKVIKVAVCADLSGIVIRVQDEGGGMPFNSAEQMWSYTFSTHEDTNEGDEPANVDSPAGAAEERPWGVFDEQNPISGRGMGLRLSRLYAIYLGGTLEVLNMPGLGMDTYLSFKRLDLESG